VKTVGVFLHPVSASKKNPKNEENTVPVPGSDTAELLTQNRVYQLEEYIMPQQYTFDAFRDAMSANGQLVRFKDPLNKKMSLSENIYRETVSSGSIKGDILYSRVWFNTPELCSGSINATITKIRY
jgi:hypothetical protein